VYRTDCKEITMPEFTSTTAKIQPYVPTDVEEAGMKDIVELIVSKDPFEIDISLLTDQDKCHLERMSKILVSMFTKSIPDIPNNELAVLLNFGQITMLATYIVNRLGKAHLTTSMKARVKAKTIELYNGSLPEHISELLNTGNINFILDYYRYIGEQIAEGNYDKFISVYYHDQSK
jgi:hypothetical protein